MKPNPQYQNVNVEKALQNTESIFYLYQKLIALKKSDDVLIHGLFERIKTSSDRVFAYTRSNGADRRLIILNFSAQNQSFDEIPIATINYFLVVKSNQIAQSKSIRGSNL